MKYMQIKEVGKRGQCQEEKLLKYVLCMYEDICMYENVKKKIFFVWF